MKAADYRKRATSEHSLQTMVLEHLRLRAVADSFVFAIPNAGMRSFAVASRMKAEGMTAGVADLCVMLSGGRTIWLELKAGRGRQSEAQKAFQDICNRLSHVYILARSFDEAIDSLQAFGAVKKDNK
jgi:hypothetical protein